jgi:alkylhydroperoxidase/carboxymuconolactone decarboxylase family protein YurZ
VDADVRAVVGCTAAAGGRTGAHVTDEVEQGERRARGFAVYREVYGDDPPQVPAGDDTTFFELLVIDQQFAEVWSRRALSIPVRRLLTIGVLAATQRYDTVEFQFRRTLTTGELTPEQVREAVIHLITYLGTPSSGGLHQAGERAIEAHLAEQGGAPS